MATKLGQSICFACQDNALIFVAFRLGALLVLAKGVMLLDARRSRNLLFFLKLRKRVALSLLLLASACTETQLSSPTDPKPILEASIKVDLPKDPTNKGPGACDLPWGGWIENGETIDAFNRETLPCAEFCRDRKQIRTCTDGVLSGDAAFEFSTCREQGCDSCNLQRPGSATTHVIRHGETVDIFQRSSVACRESCDPFKARATCNRGVFEDVNGLADLAGYDFVSCQAQPCSCQAPDPDNPGQMLSYEHGAELAFYKTETSACVTCEMNRAIRTCENGRWSGANTHTFRSCSSTPCLNCQHPQAGQPEIMHGADIETFLQQAPVCPTACRSTRRICMNGMLQGGRLPDGTDRSQYVWSGCQCSCEIRGAVGNPPTRLNQGEVLTRYLAPTAACGANRDEFTIRISCGPTGPEARRVSDNAVLDLANFNQWSQNFNIETCRCQTPWGTTVNEGLTPTTGLQSFHRRDTAECDVACESRSFQCQRRDNAMVFWDLARNEARAAAVWQHRDCVYTPCRICRHPQTQAEIAHNASVTLFREQAPSCPTACQSTPRQCLNGTLQEGLLGDGTNRTDYIWNSCGCNCPIPGAAPLAGGSSITRYTQAEAACGSNAEDYRILISCSATSGLSVVGPGGTPADINQFLSWFQSINIPVCRCNTPWGSTVDEGGSTTGYRAANVTCDNTCTPQTMFCRRAGSNLILRDASNQPIDLTIWRFGSCVRPQCRCSTPWGEMQHNHTRTAYPATVPQCGTGCAATGVGVRCDGDTESLNPVNIARPFDPTVHRHGYCSDVTCQGFGGDGNGGGEGDGFGRGRYADDGGALGSGGPVWAVGCDLIQPPATHDDVVRLSMDTLMPTGSSMRNRCRLPWATPPPAPVPEAFGMGGIIAAGVTFKAFTRNEVSCNERCEDFQVTLLCEYDGIIHRPSGALFPTCAKEPGCP